jgi:hypothetical protein
LALSGPDIDRKFRFRALEAAWQSRNAGLISNGLGRACAANHAIVTTSGLLPVSEFLIVGWHHGSLSLIGYYVGRFELSAIRAAL